MRSHRVFVILSVVVVLFVSLCANTGQVKAYGNSTFTVNCPIIHVVTTSDSPFVTPGGVKYVQGVIKNLTTGFSMHTSFNATGHTAPFYTFDWTLDTRLISPPTSFSPGDVVSLYFYDQDSVVLQVNATCPYSGTTFPTGYRLMTITCTTAYLASPGGPVLGGHVVAGQRRYVLLMGALGPDGQPYDKVEGAANLYGYLPRRCIGL